MPNFNSLKFKLIAFCVVLVVIGVALRLFFGIPFIRGQVADLVSAQELSVATYVAQDVDRSLRLRQTLIGELAADLPPAILAQPDQLSAWLREHQRINPLFDGLLVLPPDGHKLIGQYPALPGRERLDYADVDWFRAAARLGDKPAIGKPARGRVSGLPLIAMAAQVRDAGGRPVAVLAGFSLLDAPGFLDSLQRTKLGESGGFLLISPADRLFVASSDPSMVLTATPAAGVNPLHDRAMNGFRGTGVTVDAKGVEEISAMASVPVTGWFVVARMPTSEAFRPIATLREITVTGSLAVLMIVMGLVAVFLSAMLQPLVEAGRAMREMASGKRALAQLPVRRGDEVGDMVLGFNRLVATLHEKEAALQSTLEKLDQLAGTDALTGAWNRRQFDDVVEREIDRSKRHGHPVSLLLLDLDLFKRINDDFGHAKGDQVLQQVADCIRGELRKSDSLTRWGGEEFMILMPDTGMSSAIVLAERVRANIAAHSFDGLFNMTASIGVAEFVAPENAAQWAARADAAMYRAKHGGRNRVEADCSERAAQSIAESRRTGFVRLIWRDRFCSGNRRIDVQHRGLFEICNKLLATIMSARPDDEVGAAIDLLMRDIVTHFRDEEDLLRSVGYPLAEQHMSLHDELMHSATELVARFRSGTMDIDALYQFLVRDLVANHILQDDRAFFPYLEAGRPDLNAASDPLGEIQLVERQ